MKLKQISTLLMASIVLISGCSNGNSSDIPSITSSENTVGEISDPMKTSDTSQQASPSSSYGLSFGADDIDLSGNLLKISPTLKGGESPTNAGFAVFIDGIPQVYSSEDSANSAYITGFDVEENSEKTHELTVQAKLDKTFDEHCIAIGSMLAPGFVPELDTPYLGNYHRMLRNFSKTLPSEISSVSEGVSVNSLSVENSVLSKEDKEKFSLGGDDESGYSIGVELLQSDNRLEKNYVVKSEETSILLKLFTYSTMPEVCKYRVSVFVNHIPVKINGDYNCVDVIMEGGKISKTDIILDNIKQGDFIYCIAAPLSEGNLLYKSDSKMVLGENNPDEIIGSSEAPNSSGEISGYTDARISPLFSISDNLFATVKSDKSISLCKVNSKGEIVKELDGYSNASLHNSKISVAKSNFYSDVSNGSFSFNANGKTVLTLLDENFEVIKSTEIKDFYQQIDFDENHIVIVNDRNELCCCDWDLLNEKVLFTLQNTIEGAEYFVDIKLGEGFVAFNAQGKVNGADADFYGVCDFSGNYEIYRKDGINYSQVCGKTALWGDRHVDVINGQMPSGEIVLYSNGKFTKIKPENSLESQDVFLTGENEFFTSGEGSDALKQYLDGKKTGEISLGKGNSADSVIRAGDVIFANVIDDSGSKLKFWELSR